jgi:hypothetical protein
VMSVFFGRPLGRESAVLPNNFECPSSRRREVRCVQASQCRYVCGALCTERPRFHLNGSSSDGKNGTCQTTDMRFDPRLAGS